MWRISLWLVINCRTCNSGYGHFSSRRNNIFLWNLWDFFVILLGKLIQSQILQIDSWKFLLIRSYTPQLHYSTYRVRYQNKFLFFSFHKKNRSGTFSDYEYSQLKRDPFIFSRFGIKKIHLWLEISTSLSCRLYLRRKRRNQRNKAMINYERSANSTLR